MASVSGAYMYCICELNLNEYQDGIRIWRVSELYLKETMNERQNGIHVWSVSELYMKTLNIVNGSC